MSIRRTLVIGANGFIGRRVVGEGAAQGRPGIAMVLPGTPRVEAAGWECLEGPVTDSPAFRQALQGCDLVINLAGNMHGARPSRFRAANVTALAELLKAVGQMPSPPRLIHVSSVAALGPALEGKPLGEGSPARPVCLYGRSKLAGERLIAAWATGREGEGPFAMGETGVSRRHPWRQKGMADIVTVGSPACLRLPLVVRPCSVYGPGDRNFLDLFRWARRGLFPRLATRTKRVQLVHVDDLARALWRAAEACLGGVLHLGNPAVVTDDDLAAALGRAVGRTLRAFFVPPGAAAIVGRLHDLVEAGTGTASLVSSGKMREMSFPCWLQDFSRQEALLPGMSWTGLDEGIAATAAWYRQEGWW
ncbi:MAG: NAD-dependent epimerase/dehydratase family protein [Candidatus Riflebacteria bacterium]|nr:NAD-dependent epimerase/dehydratase family protein [Candidatus Riflebacteria bacterium]